MELLRDRSKEFESAGVRAMAASRDSPWSHVAWMQALDLDFPLLSDWNADVIRGFGIARDYRGMKEVAQRSAFLIDAGGTVRGAWVVLLVVALSLGAGVASTWPALRHADDRFMAEGLRGLPGAAAPGDHLQTIWQLWLPGHEVGRGEAPWRDPYSFRPEADARVNFAGWPFGLLFWPLQGALGTVGAWNAFLLFGYLGAGAFTFLWLRSLGLGPGPALVGGLVFALAPYRAVQAGAGHLLGWVAMLLPLSLWAWERRRYLVAAAALASIPLSGQVHLALGAIPFFLLYALVRGGDRRWAGGAVAGGVAAGGLVLGLSVPGPLRGGGALFPDRRDFPP